MGKMPMTHHPVECECAECLYVRAEWSLIVRLYTLGESVFGPFTFLVLIILIVLDLVFLASVTAPGDRLAVFGIVVLIWMLLSVRGRRLKNGARLRARGHVLSAEPTGVFPVVPSGPALGVVVAKAKDMNGVLCGNDNEHELPVPALWRVIWPDGEHRSTYVCESCLDICIELALDDRKALLIQPLP